MCRCRCRAGSTLEPDGRLDTPSSRLVPERCPRFPPAIIRHNTTQPIHNIASSALSSLLLPLPPRQQTQHPQHTRLAHHRLPTPYPYPYPYLGATTPPGRSPCRRPPSASRPDKLPRPRPRPPLSTACYPLSTIYPLALSTAHLDGLPCSGQACYSACLPRPARPDPRPASPPTTSLTRWHGPSPQCPRWRRRPVFARPDALYAASAPAHPRHAPSC
jgi:hypothetical protein